MIIRRETLQAVLPAVQANDATHRLDKIEVNPAGQVTATNGHLLLSATERTRMLDADFPQKDLPAYHGDSTEAVTIDAAFVDRVLKGMAKKSSIPILQCVQLGFNGDGTYLAATDLQAPTVIRIKPQDEQPGGFPKWDRIIPTKDRPAITIEIAAEVLIALAQAAKVAQGRGGGRTPSVRIYVPTDAEHRDEGNGQVIATMRVEMAGAELDIVGAFASVRR